MRSALSRVLAPQKPSWAKASRAASTIRSRRDPALCAVASVMAGFRSLDNPVGAIAVCYWSIDKSQRTPSEDPMATAHLPEPSPPNLRPSRFSHLGLKTARFDEMTAWYKTVLPAKPMFENGVVCFLTCDEEHHRLRIGNDPNATPRDAKAAGVVHFAYAVERHRERVPEEEILQVDLYR